MARRSRRPACTRRTATTTSSRRSGARDVLVHHPYESFATSVEAFVGAAARDPAVRALKTTVYRTSDESPLVPALMSAAEDGQAERLPRRAEGALRRAAQHRVVARARAGGRPRRLRLPRSEDPREDDARRPPRGRPRCAATSTSAPGNYHAVDRARSTRTSGIFTADEDIAADVADLFNYLTGFGRPQRFRKLLVAPFALRDGSIERDPPGRRRRGRRQAAPRSGSRSNALTDPAIIDELYAASQAGAAIDIIARSICMLRPGVDGLSETIRVRSVLGRFLEHSRIFSSSRPATRRLPDRAAPT